MLPMSFAVAKYAFAFTPSLKDGWFEWYGDVLGMQKHSKRVSYWLFVLQVPDNRMSNKCTVYTQLMSAARFRSKLNQGTRLTSKVSPTQYIDVSLRHFGIIAVD